MNYKFFMLLSIVLLFVAVPVHGLTIDKVYTIPENLSADESYLFVVETSAITEDSSRVSWSLTTPQKKAAGNFNKINPRKWACFFADDDTNTCGPIVFDNVATGVIFDINAETPDESQSTSFTFNSGELKFDEEDFQINPNTNNVFIGLNVIGNVQGDVRYTIYDSELNIVNSDKMGYFPQTSVNYKLDMNLSSGEYYLLFEADTSDKGSGGYVKHITIGGSTVFSKINAGAVTDIVNKNLGETYQKTIKLENPSNDNYPNISVEVPSDISNLVKASIDKSELNAGDSANLDFKVENIKTSLFIDNSLKIYSGTGSNKTLIGEVPIDLTINLLTHASGNLPVASVSPAAWVSDNQPLASDTLSKTFDVNNVGNADLTLTNYTVEGLPKDKVTVNLPSTPISPGSKGQVSVQFIPPNEGSFTGKIILHSNAADEAIEVNIRVYKNLANDISSLKADVKNKKSNLIKKGYSADQINKTFSFIERKIDQADNDYDRDDHDSARINYAIAKDQFRALDDILKLPSGGGNPLGIIQIVVIVIILALIGFVVYKKKFSKPKADDEYYDDEYDDEKEEYS